MNVLLALLIASGLIVWLISGVSRMYSYVLGPSSLDVFILERFRIVSIPYSDIVSVWAADCLGATRVGLLPLRLKNRFALRVVVVEKKTGVFRTVILTPEDADEFSSDLVSARGRGLLKKSD